MNTSKSNQLGLVNDLHISIPELDERGLTYEEFYRTMLVTLKHQVHYLREIHPSNTIDDISAYPLVIINRILNNSITLYNVIERDKDYTIANTIIRSMADSISSLYFIYNETDDEMKLLRHYLFIMDGLNGRVKLLPDSKEYDHKIKREEYDKLLHQIHESKRNFTNAINHCITTIQSQSLYSRNKASIDKIIHTNNWRFKSLNSSDKNAYNWKELYGYLDLCCDSSYFSNLSEFVHGLSTSNLNFDINSTLFEPVYGIATSLLGKLHEVLKNYFKSDIDTIKLKMLSALKDEGMPQKYINYIINKSLKQM